MMNLTRHLIAVLLNTIAVLLIRMESHEFVYDIVENLITIIL